MNDSPTDPIHRRRAGDEKARAVRFGRYRHYLDALARAPLGRHLRTKCDASDIAQQTLLEAHRDFEGFQGEHEGQLLAWLRRILAHNLFNEARRYAAGPGDIAREMSMDAVRAGEEQSSLALGRGIAASTPSPSQDAVRRKSAVRLADALARLPEDCRTVLLLRIFEELPAGEVAERISRTAGAIRMLQTRALEALRQELDFQPTD